MLFIFFTLLLLVCCKEQVQPGKNTFGLRKLADSLSLDKEKNIIICSVNPNDCINCLYGFTLIDQRLQASGNSKLYVVPVQRKIEKQELIRTTKTIALKDSLHKLVVWDKALFTNLKILTKGATSASFLLIYNYKSDSILYNKPVKFISDARELDVFLEK